MKKKQFLITKLKFHSGLHISRGLSDDYSTSDGLLRSDTISGALASAYALLFGPNDIFNFINSIKNSSAYPFVGDTLFFPKPLIKLPIDNEWIIEKGIAKNIKKAEFVEQQVFEKIIKFEKVFPEKEHFKSNFWFESGNEAKVILGKELQQRVYVPRDGGENTTPFYLEKTFFSKGAGLFFIVEAEEESLKKLKRCLNHLALQGIGTDRSVGNGGFDYELKTIEINLPSDANMQMILSLWCPQQNEISIDFIKSSSYQIVKRGGFMAGSEQEKFRHLRKKSVYMFTECSVFPIGSLKGKILDNIAPEWNDSLMHKVYRDGRCIALPIKTQ